MFYNGKPVVLSLMAVMETPVKVHKSKKLNFYHFRIQKKWNKRYGFKQEPSCFEMHGRFIMHPEFAKALKDKIQ